MQLAHPFVGFFVGLIFGFKPHARLAKHEREGTNVARKISQRKLNAGNRTASKQREVELFFRLKIVKNEVRKIGNEDETGNFIGAAFAREVFDVAKCLRLGLRQIFAPAFVFDDELAPPEQINGVDVAVKIADIGLERGDGRATDAEYVEKFVVERLFVGTLRGCVASITGETNRTVTHLAPREMWHGCSCARESACCVW